MTAQPDLYALIGVERTASAAEIRKAYRRRAKCAHPDGGGSIEEFTMLSKALSVLTDERRRKIYDETGRIDEAVIDNELTDALQRVMMAVDASVREAVQKRLDVDRLDIVDGAKRFLEATKGQALQKIEQLRIAEADTKKLAGKFKAKRGKIDRIGPMILSRLVDVCQSMEKERKDCARIEKAIEILSEHEFSFERGPMNQRGSVLPLMFRLG